MPLTELTLSEGYLLCAYCFFRSRFFHVDPDQSQLNRAGENITQSKQVNIILRRMKKVF